MDDNRPLQYLEDLQRVALAVAKVVAVLQVLEIVFRRGSQPRRFR